MAVSLGLLKYKLVYAARESVAKQRRMFSFDFSTHVVTHVIHFYFKYKAMISCKSKRKAHSLSKSKGNEKHQITLSFGEGRSLF